MSGQSLVDLVLKFATVEREITRCESLDDSCSIVRDIVRRRPFFGIPAISYMINVAESFVIRCSNILLAWILVFSEVIIASEKLVCRLH
jgi:hypothetical protein